MTTGPTCLPHPLMRCVDEVGAALDDVVGCDPAYLPPGSKRELLLELHRQTERLKALELRVLHTCDDLAAEEAARSVGEWFAHRTRSDRGPSVRDAVLAEALDERYPALSADVTAGGASIEQARAIVEALDALPADLDPEIARKAEACLVDLATKFRPGQLRRLGRRILDTVAPEIAEERERPRLEDEERRARESTSLTFRRRGDNTSDLRAWIPDAIAQRLRNHLRSYAAPRRAHLDDRSEAPGIDPETGKRIPYSRLLGQAFCTFIENYPDDLLPQHGGTATAVNLVVDLEDLHRRTRDHRAGHASTPDGDVNVSLDELLREACNGRIVPWVFDTDGQPLWMWRASRLFKPHQRKAMVLRDQECRAENCTMPAEFCEAHHKTPWFTGGGTDVDDGVLLCPWHHHRAHDPDYRVKYLPSGDVRYHRRT